MRGFAMKKIGEIGWVEKDVQKCGPLDAICRPLALAPCTSDIHTVYEGAVGERTDMILGHEAVGQVVEVGSLVKDFKPGDKVIVPAITPDWGSLEAQRGFAMHSNGPLGGWKFSNFKDGVFAELFHVNEADANLAFLPKGMDPAEASMISDMVPTGFHGVENAEVAFGEDVLVIGIGPVGLMAVKGTSLRGAARILAVGTRPNCVALAKEYGATDIISYKDGPIDQQVRELTNGKGVDKVIIAGGTVDTFAEAVKCVKPGGIVSNVNYLGSGEFIKIPRIEWIVGMGHIRIVGGLMPSGRMRTERLANLMMNGRIDVSGMLTHKFEGLDSVEEGIQLMREKPKDLIKPVITINY
ncbi:MAG: NAD(P)-dependent alcohol dehydrogenase [Tissierellia bacterium]|nr:NAD(P)-dependent alcohol dehydrogenase [Tissierellia bacterium]MDD4726224.1 NAD(P)-dependent alcohol dehydrogenase [Tissierellia bacterium]